MDVILFNKPQGRRCPIVFRNQYSCLNLMQFELHRLTAHNPSIIRLMKHANPETPDR